MTVSLTKTSRLREWRNRVVLVVVSLLIAILLAELATRLFFPISDRRDNLLLDGRNIVSYVTPGTVYRQISNEYDALTTITDKGHRAPAVEGDPEIVFIGDSFTFGHGLNDAETFASIYCGRTGRACANLGLPSSGTVKQVERLEEFLDRWQWHPREVRLFFFGMSGSFSAGNDFVDNYHRAVTREAAVRNPTQPADADGGSRGVTERIIGLQAALLRHSNLMRMLKFHAGPRLKAMFIAEPGEERMRKALDATRQGLQRLDELSRQRGFDYRIYLIVPVQDLLRGSYPDTLATLQSVAPVSVISTAESLLDSPTRYYYAFDGHLNSIGSRRVAEFLVAEDSEHARND